MEHDLQLTNILLFFRRMENAFEKEYVNGGLNGEQVLIGNNRAIFCDNNLKVEKHLKNPRIFSQTVSIGELQPEDIWMSEGKLLVLKGSSSATSRQGYYDPWEPLDDYQVGFLSEN